MKMAVLHCTALT